MGLGIYPVLQIHKKRNHLSVPDPTVEEWILLLTKPWHKTHPFFFNTKTYTVLNLYRQLSTIANKLAAFKTQILSHLPLLLSPQSIGQGYHWNLFWCKNLHTPRQSAGEMHLCTSRSVESDMRFRWQVVHVLDSWSNMGQQQLNWKYHIIQATNKMLQFRIISVFQGWDGWNTVVYQRHLAYGWVSCILPVKKPVGSTWWGEVIQCSESTMGGHLNWEKIRTASLKKTYHCSRRGIHSTWEF